MTAKRKKKIALLIIGAVLMILAVVDVYLYLKFGTQELEKKVSILFAIVGLYGLSIAMFTKLKASKNRWQSEGK